MAKFQVFKEGKLILFLPSLELFELTFKKKCIKNPRKLSKYRPTYRKNINRSIANVNISKQAW